MASHPETVTSEGTMLPSAIHLRRHAPGLAVVSLEGEHDLATAAALRVTLADAIAEGRAIVLELTPARFIDSSILGVIIASLRAARAAGVGAAIVLERERAPQVERLLDLTSLEPIFPVYPSLAEATSAALAGLNTRPGW